MYPVRRRTRRASSPIRRANNRYRALARIGPTSGRGAVFAGASRVRAYRWYAFRFAAYFRIARFAIKSFRCPRFIKALPRTRRAAIFAIYCVVAVDCVVARDCVARHVLSVYRAIGRDRGVRVGLDLMRDRALLFVERAARRQRMFAVEKRGESKACASGRIAADRVAAEAEACRESANRHRAVDYAHVAVSCRDLP